MIPGVDEKKLNELRDRIARRTAPADVETHELLKELENLLRVAEGLEQDRHRAWGAADYMAWRTYAEAAFQAFLTMNGIQKVNDIVLLDATKAESDKRLSAIAQLAEDAGQVMMERDRKRRER